MKKYRYGDPTKVSFWRKYGNFLYFFAAWNLFGMVAWKAMSINKKEEDSNWDKKTTSEKYLSLIGYGENSKTEVTHVKMTGLKMDPTSPESST